MKTTKSLIVSWISLISILTIITGCSKYTVTWNDLRDAPKNDSVIITFKSEQSNRLKDIHLSSNRTEKISIPSEYYDMGCSCSIDVSFQYFIDYETKQIEIYLMDNRFDDEINDKILLHSKKDVLGYQLMFTDFDNNCLVTVASRDPLLEIPPFESRIDSNILTLPDMLKKMENEDLCYYQKLDKEHLSLYPSATVYYLVKGRVLNELYWVSSSYSGTIDYYIDKNIIPVWLNECVDKTLDRLTS